MAPYISGWMIMTPCPRQVLQIVLLVMAVPKSTCSCVINPLFYFARAVGSGISKAVSFVILGFWAVDVDIQPGGLTSGRASKPTKTLPPQ